MKIRLCILFCVCLFSAGSFAASEETPGPIVLSLPDINWALEINAPGFSLEEFEIAPPGHASRFQAVNRQSGINMSGFLEKAPKKGNSEDCRAYYWEKAQKSPYPKTDIKMSQSGEMSIVEYFVKEYMGRQVNQKNFNAYIAESDYWIDIHLSKVDYQPNDQERFNAILNQVKIIKDYKPDALILFHYGNHFFAQEKYLQAIPYYQESLNLENSNRTMSKNFWLGLVDQLGLAYGISGNIEKAIETYSAAITKEPEYPMFYYNLACAYAENNDLEGAIRNLNLSFKYKKNLLPGEELPDPRSDSSFKRFLNNKKFIEEVNKME
jgi:tetratricopeptide (TPR) repeat protein